MCTASVCATTNPVRLAVCMRMRPDPDTQHGGGPHRFSMGSKARSTAEEGEGPPRTAPGASTRLVSHLASSGGGPFLAPLAPWGRLRCGGRSACSKWRHDGDEVLQECSRVVSDVECLHQRRLLTEAQVHQLAKLSPGSQAPRVSPCPRLRTPPLGSPWTHTCTNE